MNGVPLSTAFATSDLTEVVCPEDIRELLSPNEDTPVYDGILAKRASRSTQGWKALMTAVEEPAVEEPADDPEPEPVVTEETVAEEPEPAPVEE